ncbi:MAG: internal scaffolding protein [Microvirus sp.]|nr:MAG: internal scaffolding protein [Microvirus sp.]
MLNHYFFSRYNPPPSPVLSCPEETLTQQQFQDECDINNILAKFTQTGILPDIGPGYYEDLADQGDYRQALHTLKAGNDAFAELPALTRKYFDNDPMNYMEFVQNSDNYEKGKELGIFNERVNNLQIQPKPDPLP